MPSGRHFLVRIIIKSRNQSPIPFSPVTVGPNFVWICLNLGITIDYITIHQIILSMICVIRRYIIIIFLINVIRLVHILDLWISKRYLILRNPSTDCKHCFVVHLIPYFFISYSKACAVRLEGNSFFVNRGLPYCQLHKSGNWN